MRRLLTLALLLPLAITLPARAQFAPSAPAPTTYKDTSMIKPPVGSKVALWEFEDMECPLCAHDAPIVRKAIRDYKIAYVRHDFPLGPMHPWSGDAAIYARYIQLNKSPEVAEQYRLAVFAAQAGISNKDDLHNFTTHFASAHGILWPFVVDPQGKLASLVNADKALGDRIGVQHTPTLWVVTNHGIFEIQDINQLYATIDSAIAFTNKTK
jgi:protein-disulfide isomerase